MMPRLNDYFNSAVNITPARNVYPDAAGASLGQVAGAQTPYTMGPINEPVTTDVGGDTEGATAAPRGVLGQPLAAWVGLIVLFLVLGFAAKKAGQATEFSNIRLSGYNILTITLAAIIGITGLKIVFTRFTVPGITPLVQAV